MTQEWHSHPEIPPRRSDSALRLPPGFSAQQTRTVVFYCADFGKISKQLSCFSRFSFSVCFSSISAFLAESKGKLFLSMVHTQTDKATLGPRDKVAYRGLGSCPSGATYGLPQGSAGKNTVPSIWTLKLSGKHRTNSSTWPSQHYLIT